MYTHVKLKFQQAMHTDTAQIETHSLPLYGVQFWFLSRKEACLFIPIGCVL